MFRLRTMTAHASENRLVSYQTTTAIKSGNYAIIWDYPSMTSKKHLLAWLEDLHGLNSYKAGCFEMFKDFASSAYASIKSARKHKHQFILLNKDSDGFWGYCTYDTYNEMISDFDYKLAIAKEPNLKVL